MPGILIVNGCLLLCLICLQSSRSTLMYSTVGVISDTHGLLRPAARDILRGCDLILHAGDIGAAEIAEALGSLAPVHAVRGNVDNGAWARRYPATEVVTFNAHYFYLLHNLAELDIDPAAAGFSAVISGHSHQPLIRRHNGVLYINPGSAGPRRFALPVTVAKITVADDALTAEIIELAV